MAMTRLLQAIVVALLVITVLSPVLPQATAQVNRPPVSNPGPDVTTPESAPGTTPTPRGPSPAYISLCQAVIDPTLPVVSRYRAYDNAGTTTSITPNVRTISGTNSYDPDGADATISYVWHQVDKPSGAPDLCLIAGPNEGEQDIYVPNILPFQSPALTYTIRLAILDGPITRSFNDGAATAASTNLNSPVKAKFSGADVGQPVTGPGIPGPASIPAKPCTLITARLSATDVTLAAATTASSTAGTFTINTPQLGCVDPYGGYCGFNPLACKTMKFTVTNTNQSPKFSAAPFSSISPGSVDLVENRGNNAPPALPTKVTFTTAPILDDRQTVAVLVTLHDAKEAHHNLTVQLTKQTGTTVNPTTHEETSTWSGSLNVDTPELITGTYDVTAQAFDADGASDSTLAGEIDFDVSASLASRNLPHINLNQLPSARPHADACFPGVPRVSPQVFGPGQILRPEIFIDRATDPDLYLPPAPLSSYPDPLLMLRKVTYQVCFQTGSNPGVGPEITLASPFFISEDTLFAGQTDVKDIVVKVTAYDRSRGINTTAIPLVLGLGNPEVFVDRPAISYQGIPFGFTVYTHDRVDATAQLRIDDFNSTAGPFDVRATNNGTKTPAGTIAFNMPAYDQLVRYDTNGDGLCEVLLDLNGNGKLDAAYTPLNLTLGAILYDAKAPARYIVDTNHDGIANAGERFILENATTKSIELKGAPPCALPFAPDLTAFLTTGQTQVFVFTLNRNQLGIAHYTVTVSDVAHNAGIIVKGTFTTEKAGTDARVVSAAVSAGPFLPGDLVLLNVVVRHDTALVPKPRPELRVTLTDNGRALTMSANRTHPLYTKTPQLAPGVDFEVPIQAREFLPGIHGVVAGVTVPPLVNETDSNNNAAGPVKFEVYLGMVVQGKSFDSGARYYIRADQSGLPILRGGAVELGVDGKVLRPHDLTFAQDPDVRYVFTVHDKDGKNQTLAWDPLARYSITFSKDCAQLSAAERVVDRAAEPPKDPKCRAITLSQAAAQSTTTKAPAPAVLGALGAVFVAFALRRRRAA